MPTPVRGSACTEGIFLPFCPLASHARIIPKIHTQRRFLRMPQRLTLREIQLAELDILLKVTEYFDSPGIYYLLCSGTMLGAVRHKGFIPWDD
ncbi:MAG: LicD family protein, partial [Synergistaceae bacterium]|nr:LicD family protein [Synergistaceae bacterium]